ncbi:MAG: arginine deiminase-related protein, partial [Candidatus Limnocylindrus sp.]
MTQSPHAVLMINPLGFNPNPETAADNAFQDAEIVDASERAAVAAEARVEVARIAQGLRGLGVEVLLIDDLPGSDVPDSVFPNNWISTHEDGRVVLYPMATPSRRRERRADVIAALRERYVVSDVVDLSAMEEDALYLEGTGALVLDHVGRVAYVARSGRAHTAAALRWCSEMGYDAEIFDTVDVKGAPIYHTNVVLSIGSAFATAGLENIPDPTERARVLARLTASGREVVTLDPRQVAEFAGNGLELLGADGRRIFALSARAAAALQADQRAQIERFAHVFPISI